MTEPVGVERALLGAIMLDPAGQQPLLDLVAEGDLRRPWHGQVLAAMRRVRSRGVLPGAIEVYEELKREPDLPRSVSADAVPLADLMEAAPRPSHAPAYAAIVIGGAIRRRLGVAASRMQQAAREVYADQGRLDEGDLEAAWCMMSRARRELAACRARWAALPESMRRQLPATRRDASEHASIARRAALVREEIGRLHEDLWGLGGDDLAARLASVLQQLTENAAASASQAERQALTKASREARPAGEAADASGMAVLRDLAADPSRLSQVGDWLRPGHFARPEHGELYAVIRDLRAARLPVDPVTISFEARRRGVDLAPGELAGGTGAFAAADGHQLHRRAMLAQVASAGREILARFRPRIIHQRPDQGGRPADAPHRAGTAAAASRRGAARRAGPRAAGPCGRQPARARSPSSGTGWQGGHRMITHAGDVAFPARVSEVRSRQRGPRPRATAAPYAGTVGGQMTGAGGCSGRRPRAAGAGCGQVADDGRGYRSRQEYARWRARQIAYGRWEPWADAAPVRAHVLRLRRAGASYQAIACAAGVSAMTVHRLLRGCPAKGQPVPARIGAAHARRLLAVAADGSCGGRRSACGSRRRLQALVAIGHSASALASALEVTPRWVRRLLGGQTRTVSPAMHGRVRDVYERMWDELPPERTGTERASARAARQWAEAERWPPPMGLDDDRIDDPDYRTRIAWQRASGTAMSALQGWPSHRPAADDGSKRPALAIHAPSRLARALDARATTPASRPQ